MPTPKIRLPPDPPTDRIRPVTFKAPERLIYDLDRYALINGISRSEAIRKAIELLLKLEASREPPIPRRVTLLS